MKTLFKEIKRIILDIPDPADESKQLFKTVKLDKGQFERIIHNQENKEFGYEFPAVFIHFVNVSYLVSQNRIGEGRGTMRVRFVLNRLNDQDDDFETEIFDYAGYINAAIQDAKDTSTVLKERVTLEYFDMPTSSNQLQPCWLDYNVHFTDQSGDKYRNWIKRTIVTPMFTNFSDMTEENQAGREDVGPEGYEGQPDIDENLNEDPNATYNVIFSIVKQWTPIEGITVEFDGKSASTTKLGYAAFIGISNETYQYSIKDGEATLYSGDITVHNSNIVRTFNIQ